MVGVGSRPPLLRKLRPAWRASRPTSFCERSPAAYHTKSCLTRGARSGSRNQRTAHRGTHQAARSKSSRLVRSHSTSKLFEPVSRGSLEFESGRWRAVVAG